MRWGMNISYSQVESQCNQLHETAKKMKDILDMVSEIRKNACNSASWNGEASNAYSEKLSLLIGSFDEAFLEIENSILYMASCSSGYQALDQQVMQEICSNLNITEPNLSTSNIFGVN